MHIASGTFAIHLSTKSRSPKSFQVFLGDYAMPTAKQEKGLTYIRGRHCPVLVLVTPDIVIQGSLFWSVSLLVMILCLSAILCFGVYY